MREFRCPICGHRQYTTGLCTECEQANVIPTDRDKHSSEFREVPNQQEEHGEKKKYICQNCGKTFYGCFKNNICPSCNTPSLDEDRYTKENKVKAKPNRSGYNRRSLYDIGQGKKVARKTRSIILDIIFIATVVFGIFAILTLSKTLYTGGNNIYTEESISNTQNGENIQDDDIESSENGDDSSDFNLGYQEYNEIYPEIEYSDLVNDYDYYTYENVRIVVRFDKIASSGNNWSCYSSSNYAWNGDLYIVNYNIEPSIKSGDIAIIYGYIDESEYQSDGIGEVIPVVYAEESYILSDEQAEQVLNSNLMSFTDDYKSWISDMMHGDFSGISDGIGETTKDLEGLLNGFMNSGE